MPKYTLKYLDGNYKVVSQERRMTCKNQSEAVLQFAKEEPTNFPFIDVLSWAKGRQRVDNPFTEEIAKKETQAEESQRLAEVELLKKIIIAANTPLQLSFSQLEFLIENFNLFPTLEKGDEEIYSLREKLYMLSFWNTAFQSSLQTRLLSQIASVTSAPQTGSSGSGQPKWAPLAAMAAVSKLGNIETDVDDMADGFFGED